MELDINTIENAISTTTNVVNKAVIRPLGAFGILGFTFPIPKREIIDDGSDVTDHVSQNREFITDNITQKPLKIILMGSVGNLIYRYKRQTINAGLQQIANKISAIVEYGGDLTTGTIQLIKQTYGANALTLNEYSKILIDAGNLWTALKNAIPFTNEQTQAVRFLQTIKSIGLIMSVQTPWGYYQNMVIENITNESLEDTYDSTDIQIEFKQVNFIDAQFQSTSNPDNMQGRVAQQSQSPNPQGTTRTRPANKDTIIANGKASINALFGFLR